MNYSSELKLLISLGLNIIVLVFMSIINTHAIIFLINIMILITYIFHRPKNIFNPKNMVFVFSFLYILLPSSVEYIYDIYNLDYLLPWGKPVEWYRYELSTYYDMYLLYLFLFYSFHLFLKKEYVNKITDFKINRIKLYILVTITLLSLILYMQLTGGIGNWISNYKETFLLGRGGVGLFNFVTLLLVNISVFLLGLYSFKSNKKKFIILFSILFIIFAAYIQGLKSRIIILLIIFYFPYLYQMNLKLSKLVILGILFFVLLFIGNYIRSDGYYDSGAIFFEYMMTYFNIYEIHNLIVLESDAEFFKTLHYSFVKPLISLGFLDSDTAYDLSVELTKKYFPKDWELMRATQQWPLTTYIYYNYYGFYFGWIPIVLYAFLISQLYKEMSKGNIAISLVFILEFFRIFTIQRGEFIPWQMPIYIVFYIIIYYVVKNVIYLNHTYENSQ